MPADLVSGVHPIPAAPPYCVFCSRPARCRVGNAFACAKCCGWCEAGHCTPIREAIE